MGESVNVIDITIGDIGKIVQLTFLRIPPCLVLVCVDDRSFASGYLFRAIRRRWFAATLFVRYHDESLDAIKSRTKMMNINIASD